MKFSQQQNAVIQLLKEEYKDNLNTVRIAINKNNNLVVLVDEKTDENNNVINAYLYTETKKHLAGFLTYKIGKGVFFYSRETVIANLEVKEEFQNMGIAGYIERFLTEKTVNNRVDYITGKFYPGNEHSANFYTSRGYEIEKEGYETLLLKRVSDHDKDMINENKVDVDGITFYNNIIKTQKNMNTK